MYRRKATLDKVRKNFKSIIEFYDEENQEQIFKVFYDMTENMSKFNLRRLLYDYMALHVYYSDIKEEQISFEELKNLNNKIHIKKSEFTNKKNINIEGEKSYENKY